MSRSLQILCRVAILLVGMGALVGAAAASDDEVESVVAQTSFPSAIFGADSGTLDDACLVHRFTEDRDGASPGFRFNGTAAHLTVTRYEASWVRFDASPIMRPAGAENLDPEGEPTEYANARFEYTAGADQPAAILQVESAELERAMPRLDVWGVRHDPFVVSGDSAKGPVAYAGPDERASHRLNGSYLVSEADGYAGHGSGAFRFYWVHGTVRLSTPDGPVELTSRAWNDTVASSPRAWLRHVVWYEIEAVDASVEFAASQQDADAPVRSFVLARGVDLNGVASIAMDTQTRMEGDLRDAVESDGSSLWLAGTLDVAAAPAREADDPAGYEYRITGDIGHYAVGGGPAVPFASSIALSTSAVAVLVVLILFAGEILHAVGRVVAPLYGKIHKDDVLDLGVRERIFETVRAEPGISYFRLFRCARDGPAEANAPFGAFAHHVRQLERFGLLVSVRQGRYRRFFPAADGYASEAESLSLLRTEPVRQVADVVLASPGITPTEILVRLPDGLVGSRQLLSYHLRKLRDGQLVRVEADGRRRRYSPTRFLARLAAKSGL